MDRQTTRALQQVVSLDGWIGTFDADGTASVHADVVFRQGAFGEAADALIRFKIALKRAEIVLRIPGQEPIAVVKESIERSTKNAAGQRKKSTQTSKKFSLASKLGLSRKPTASADADAAYTLQSNEELSFQEEVQTYLEQHFTTIDGHAAWEVKTASELGVAYLSSAPWDALEAPRMKVRRSADKGPDGSPPSLIIEVRCTREDIEKTARRALRKPDHVV